MKEKRDGTTQVVVKLTGTSGESKLPVHLHLGDISTPGADVAALLNPVNSKTGTSETILKQLADESEVTYSDLIKLDACVKIHLPDVGCRCRKRYYSGWRKFRCIGIEKYWRMEEWVWSRVKVSNQYFLIMQKKPEYFRVFIIDIEVIYSPPPAST